MNDCVCRFLRLCPYRIDRTKSENHGQTDYRDLKYVQTVGNAPAHQRTSVGAIHHTKSEMHECLCVPACVRGIADVILNVWAER